MNRQGTKRTPGDRGGVQVGSTDRIGYARCGSTSYVRGLAAWVAAAEQHPLRLSAEFYGPALCGQRPKSPDKGENFPIPLVGYASA